jgi:hypothetical protein
VVRRQCGGGMVAQAGRPKARGAVAAEATGSGRGTLQVGDVRVQGRMG